MRRKVKVVISVFYFLKWTCFAAPKAQVIATVYDGSGFPVEGAKVEIVGVVKKEPGKGWGAKTIKGYSVTDDKGVAKLSVRSEGSLISLNVNKDGFYRSGVGYRMSRKNHIMNRWEPSNAVIEVLLKEKKDPVPMYFYKKTSLIKVPVFGEPVGYDFSAGDWVAPYGTGIHQDVSVLVKRRFAGARDYDIHATLSFAENDGIQEVKMEEDPSHFKWPYVAPLMGYKQELQFKKYRHPDGERFADNNYGNLNYIFRVRTVKDEKGNIISACYGRIPGGVDLTWGDYINWVYYLNADPNSRSLEYSGENLF